MVLLPHVLLRLFLVPVLFGNRVLFHRVMASHILLVFVKKKALLRAPE